MNQSIPYRFNNVNWAFQTQSPVKDTGTEAYGYGRHYPQILSCWFRYLNLSQLYHTCTTPILGCANGVVMNRGPNMYTRTDKYLTRYADRYRVRIREDGCAYIQTRFKPDPWGMTYEVYVYNDELIAACLPPRTARSLMKRFPGRFRKHQEAEDGVVLLTI